MKRPFSMFEVADLLHRYPARQMVDHTHKFAQGTGEELRGHTIKTEFALALLEPAVRDGDRIFQQYARAIEIERNSQEVKREQRKAERERKTAEEEAKRAALYAELDELLSSTPLFGRVAHQERIHKVQNKIWNIRDRGWIDIASEGFLREGYFVDRWRKLLDRWRYLAELMRMSPDTVQLSKADTNILIGLSRNGTQAMNEEFAKHFKEQDHE